MLPTEPEYGEGYADVAGDVAGAYGLYAEGVAGTTEGTAYDCVTAGGAYGDCEDVAGTTGGTAYDFVAAEGAYGDCEDVAGTTGGTVYDCVAAVGA